MTQQEQTITDLCKKWKVSLTVAIEIWNAAVDMAAEKAHAKQTISGFVVSAYVDTQSITNLKIK